MQCKVSPHRLFHQEATLLPVDLAPITLVLVGPSFVHPLDFNAQFFLQRANKRKSPIGNRIIALDENIRWLFQKCQIGRGNAGLFSEALAHSEPEDLKKKDVIKVYHVYIHHCNVFNMAVLRSSMIYVGHLKNLYMPKFLGHQLAQSVHAPWKIRQILHGIIPILMVWTMELKMVVYQLKKPWRSAQVKTGPRRPR